MLKNYMEILVDQIFNEVKNNYDICKDEKCAHDIKAMALNELPPAYFSSSTNEGEKKAFLVQKQRNITVLAKITEAANIVCHDCKHRKKMRDNK